MRQSFEKAFIPVGQAILTYTLVAGRPNTIHYPSSDQIDQVCVTDDDRPEQETIVYTVTQCENIRSQLEPEYGNAHAAYISPLNEFF